MSKIEIITTSDGSHSLLNTELNETYHSTHGAIQESLHVFIKNGIEFFRQTNKPDEIKILEVGFGTGLNALLTLQYSLSESVKIHFESLEAYPVDQQTVSLLNYPAAVNFSQAEKYFTELHQSNWDEPTVITDSFTLLKRHVKLQDADLGLKKFDIIFFDAFAPSKQAEMWELAVLQKIERSMKPNGVFVTYCAKGQLKRDLKSLGIVVETLSGPPGKKEMVRALKA